MPASNLAVVFQPGLIRAPDNPAFDVVGATTPGVSIAGSTPAGPAASESLAPPHFPPLSRTSSNPATPHAASMAASGSDASAQNNNAELQRRQDEIKINQEVLEFLINHQDHFVALPATMSVTPSSSSTETSPVSPVRTAKSVNAGVAAASPPQSRSTLPLQQPQIRYVASSQDQSQSVQAGQPNLRPIPPRQQQVAAARQQQSAALDQKTLPPSQQQSSVSSPKKSVSYPQSKASLNPVQQSQPQDLPILRQKRTLSPLRIETAPSQTQLPRQMQDSASATEFRTLPSSRDRGPPDSTASPLTVPSQSNQQQRKLSQTSASSQQPQQTQHSSSSDSSSRPSREDRDKDKERQPRKLKTARIPIASSPIPPVRTPTSRWDPAQPVRAQSNELFHRPSSPYFYNEDVPLSTNAVKGTSLSSSLSGVTVKRSKTLPGSAGSPRANSPRSVCVFLISSGPTS